MAHVALSRQDEQIGMGYRPLHDRVLVRVPEPHDPKKPDGSTMAGLVLAIGPRVALGEGQALGLLQPGARVLFGRYSGTSVDGDNTLRVMHVEEILLVDTVPLAGDPAGAFS